MLAFWPVNHVSILTSQTHKHRDQLQRHRQACVSALTSAPMACWHAAGTISHRLVEILCPCDSGQPRSRLAGVSQSSNWNTSLSWVSETHARQGDTFIQNCPEPDQPEKRTRITYRGGHFITVHTTLDISHSVTTALRFSLHAGLSSVD